VVNDRAAIRLGQHPARRTLNHPQINNSNYRAIAELGSLLGMSTVQRMHITTKTDLHRIKTEKSSKVTENKAMERKGKEKKGKERKGVTRQNARYKPGKAPLVEGGECLRKESG
jgi:hypothetical protein